MCPVFTELFPQPWLLCTIFLLMIFYISPFPLIQDSCFNMCLICVFPLWLPQEMLPLINGTGLGSMAVGVALYLSRAELSSSSLWVSVVLLSFDRVSILFIIISSMSLIFLNTQRDSWPPSTRKNINKNKEYCHRKLNKKEKNSVDILKGLAAAWSSSLKSSFFL